MLIYPKITVLLTVFNTDFSLIKRAIDSVLEQDFQDFSLFVIDDGSTNDPENLVLKYIQQFENKITYIRHQNCGQSESINKAISYCRSKYITILNADDAFRPNHLVACLNEMDFADLIASTTETIVEREEDYYVRDKKNLSQLIHVDECILFATLFGKKEVFEYIPFEDMYAADAHFYEKAAQIFRVKKVNLRTYIYYRNSPNSICSQLKRKHLQSTSVSN